MKITEKAAYLKGLADGLEIDNSTKEGKLIAALVDMVDALAQKIDELDGDVQELNDYCEELDEDLGEVEEYLCEEDECECGCDCEETYEIECPKCGDVICFDESVDPAALKCPACGAEVALTAED